MWELDYKEGWAPKNWCFWTVVFEKSLEAARRSNQSILKEISPEYSLEGLMLKLKLECFGHLKRRASLLEKTLMLGKTEGKRRRGWQRKRWLDSITGSLDMNLGKVQEIVEPGFSPWDHKESDMIALNNNGYYERQIYISEYIIYKYIYLLSVKLRKLKTIIV